MGTCNQPGASTEVSRAELGTSACNQQHVAVDTLMYHGTHRNSKGAAGGALSF